MNVDRLATTRERIISPSLSVTIICKVCENLTLRSKCTLMIPFVLQAAPTMLALAAVLDGCTDALPDDADAVADALSLPEAGLLDGCFCPAAFCDVCLTD